MDILAAIQVLYTFNVRLLSKRWGDWKLRWRRQGKIIDNWGNNVHRVIVRNVGKMAKEHTR
jgi:hypothetical protein